MTFPRYPDYKDSGVEWLGEVPGHWEIKRLRFVATINPSKSEVAERDREEEVSFLPMEAIGDDGRLDLERTRAIGEVETGYTYFRENDVTIAKITPCFENGKGAVMRGLTGSVGFGTTELIVARPKEAKATSDFLHWLFVSQPFRKLGEATMYGAGGQKRVPDDFVRDFSMAFPSVPEQSAIAAFLDRETGKIDALVAEQEKLIGLLKEKRQAVISHAVTKGLDPSVPMKDSGIEWLGKVPAHWQVKRIKNVVPVIEQGWSPEAIDRLAEGDEWGVLKSGCVNHGVFRDTEHKTLPLGVVPPDGLEVSIGDLLMSRASGSIELIGSAALVERCSYRLIMSDKIFRLDVNHAECANTFLVRVLGSSALRTQIVQAISGAEGLANNIGKGAIREFWLALPPLTEQSVIAAFLNDQTAKFDTLIAESQRGIELLKEHRSALISAAVTGKIDVRGLVSPQEAA